jgi:hypothetical protein
MKIQKSHEYFKLIFFAKQPDFTRPSLATSLTASFLGTGNMSRKTASLKNDFHWVVYLNNNTSLATQIIYKWFDCSILRVQTTKI